MSAPAAIGSAQPGTTRPASPPPAAGDKFERTIVDVSPKSSLVATVPVETRFDQPMPNAGLGRKTSTKADAKPGRDAQPDVASLGRGELRLAQANLPPVPGLASPLLRTTVQPDLAGTQVIQGVQQIGEAVVNAGKSVWEFLVDRIDADIEARMQIGRDMQGGASWTMEQINKTSVELFNVLYNQFVVPGGGITSIRELTEIKPGTFVASSFAPILPGDLPHFLPAQSGVTTEDGSVQKIIPGRTLGRMQIAYQAPVGKQVTKGEVVIRQFDPALTASIQQYRDRLRQLEQEITVSIVQAPRRIQALDGQLASVDQQIALQEAKLQSSTDELQRLRQARAETGGVPGNMIAAAERTVLSSQQDLLRLQAQRADLVGQREEAGRLESMDVTMVVSAIKSGKVDLLSSLPPRTLALANEYLQVEQSLNNALAREKDLVWKSPVNGTVVGNITVIPGLDGQDPSRQTAPGSLNQQTQNYGGFAIRVDDNEPASVELRGVPPEIARRIRTGDVIPGVSSDHGLFAIRVQQVIDLGPNLGFRIAGVPTLQTPDGKGRRPTVGEMSAPIKIAPEKFGDLIEKGVITRDNEDNRFEVKRLFPDSSPNVTFLKPPSAPEFEVGKYPSRQQPIRSEIIVAHAAAGEDGTLVKRQGTLVIEGTVKSDGTKVEPVENSIRAVFHPANDGQSVTIPVEIVPTQASMVGGSSPVSGTGFNVNITTAAVTDIFAQARGGGYSLAPGGVGFSASESRVPVAPMSGTIFATLELAPTGDRTGGNIVKINAPLVIRSDRPTSEVKPVETRP